MAASTPSAPALRWIALAMAAGLVALIVLVVLLRPASGDGLPSSVVWTLAALAAASLGVGVVLAVTADARSAGYAARAVVSLALREAAGLLGALLTLLGGEPAWALGLGGAAVVALLVLMPRDAAG